MKNVFVNITVVNPQPQDQDRVGVANYVFAMS